jgi:hypothetical protein
LAALATPQHKKPDRDNSSAGVTKRSHRHTKGHRVEELRDVLVKVSIEPHAFVPLGGIWSELRSCESGGNYRDDTGNGFYGAYQFALSTWRGLQLSGLPSSASPQIQDDAAVRLQKLDGWNPWPRCAWALGL